LHEEALAIARRIGARYTELEAACNLVFCLGEMGQDEEAVRVGLCALGGAGEVFNAPLASNTAYSLLAIGRVDEAEHWYRRVLASDNASAACAASGKLLEIAARRVADEATLGRAVDAVFDALGRTGSYTVQAGALVAVLNHGRAQDVARVRPWLRDEPLYPGLQRRLDEALARHAAAADGTARAEEGGRDARAGAQGRTSGRAQPGPGGAFKPAAGAGSAAAACRTPARRSVC
jgi:tetratricopeptide (TPR) repeat protein